MIHRLLNTICGVALLATAGPAFPESPLPLPFNLGGSYELTNQFGDARTEVDPEGKPQLLFFGYVNCREICSAVFPLMAEMVTAVEQTGQEITPVMITVDPTRDTLQTMAAPLADHHPNFIGLTGSEDALQIAYDAYSIEKEEVFVDPEYGPVFAHGSFVYLLDSEGKFLTLIPPILTTDQAVDIILKHTRDLS